MVSKQDSNILGASTDIAGVPKALNSKNEELDTMISRLELV